MIEGPIASLELEDIQGIVLRERPAPYVGTYALLRIDSQADGCELLRRLLPHVTSAANWWSPTNEAWLSVALTFQGLKALGVPQPALNSFPTEFQQGMASRAAMLGDEGESSPASWEKPLGTPQVHVALALFANEATTLQHKLDVARKSLQDLPGVAVISEQHFSQLPSGRTSLGYKDGIGNPAVEGSGVPALPGQGPAIKAGQFILGYPDELGRLPPMPQPEILGRNGTYLVFRKLHTRVAAYRQFLRERAASGAEEEWLAAKLVGRWRSAAPLALTPEQDDPELGADPQRNNDFRYADDPKGLKCPLGAHIRRLNPRDTLEGQAVAVNLHRIIRRGTSYGPPLPDGVLEDDGADRGIMFIFMSTNAMRQIEFLKSQWINDGDFMQLGAEKDPLVGANDGSGTFTIPQRPIRRRLHGLNRFVITKGGEYCFVPSIGALQWLCHFDR